MKANKKGDHNHTTVEDNVAALKTKLMALHSTLRTMNESYNDSCLWHLKQWHDAREGQYFSLLQKVISDSIDACTGKYYQTATPVQLDEAHINIAENESGKPVESVLSAHARKHMRLNEIIYTNMAQKFTSVNESLQFAIQSQLNGVIQQLERLEWVADKVRRPAAIKANKEGDRNHMTVEDNVAALKTKLMALHSTLRTVDKSYSDACLWHLKQWHDAREGQYSPLLQKAISDSVDACTGKYEQDAASVQLNEAQLQECSAKLALANHKFHEKESRYSANPQAFFEKQQFPITHYEPVNEEELRRALPPQEALDTRSASFRLDNKKVPKHDGKKDKNRSCPCVMF